MTNYAKLTVLINDKRIAPRAKLFFLLLAKGFSVEEIQSFTVDDLDILKNINRGEDLFTAYAQRGTAIAKIKESGLMFPGTNGKPIQKMAILTALRRSCRLNGFQLYELGIDGLVEIPNIEKKKKPISFRDIKELIQK